MSVDVAQLKELFGAAAQLPPAERPAFLERTCAADAERRQRVEALLKAHDAPGSYLPGPAVMPPGTSEYTPASEGQVALPITEAYQPMHAPGAVIAGRYTLLEKIGEGGMGEVWVAKQTEPVKRKVALKLIKAGMDSRQVLARFDAERKPWPSWTTPISPRCWMRGRSANRLR